MHNLARGLPAVLALQLRAPTQRPALSAPLPLPADDTVNVLVTAVKPISKGQEITNSYQPGVIHRPDMSLYIYGEPVKATKDFYESCQLFYMPPGGRGRSWLDNGPRRTTEKNDTPPSKERGSSQRAQRSNLPCPRRAAPCCRTDLFRPPVAQLCGRGCTPLPAGFVIEREEPLLAAVDLPTYNSQDPFEQTPLVDSLYDGGLGSCGLHGGICLATIAQAPLYVGLMT